MQIDSLFDIKKDVQKQIDEQNKTQSQIDSGVSGLRKMNRTLNNLPDFAKMRRDISSVNKSLQAMPDLNKVTLFGFVRASLNHGLRCTW